MNRQIRWNISAGAILLFALMYFFDGRGLISALMPAVLAHELAHALTLRLCGCRLTRVSVSVFGAEMDYAPQINGLRGDTSIEKRIEHDLYYIENWTLELDFKILFLTIFRGFINKNAY